VEGVTEENGRSQHAWIYAVPEQPDGRLFQSVQSDNVGHFRIQGLRPAAYLLVATDSEQELDLHDRQGMARWLESAKRLEPKGPQRSV
jgi:hypothetical protein